MCLYKELYIKQGAYYTSNITIKDSLTNQNVNVAGYSVSGQLRRSYYSENASANLVCTVADGSNGRIQISLSSNISSNLKEGKYVYDVEAISFPGNLTMRVQEGIIIVTPQVTR